METIYSYIFIFRMIAAVVVEENSVLLIWTTGEWIGIEE